mmetsp:Transcript_128371/g.332851  ORF Transcript_128371/g.332851 Transcript_128371/m.332851 type:complete len:482 (+) Transcript_128371:1099-2544(+)
MVHGRIMLAERRVDLELVEEGVEAEGAGLVRDHRAAPLPEVAQLHELPQQIGEGHCGAHGLRVALVEELVGVPSRDLDDAGDLGWGPRGVEASQLLTPLADVLHLWGLEPGVPEELAPEACAAHLDLLVAQRDVEDVAEGHHLLVLHCFLLVHGVPARKGSKTVALQGLGQDDSGSAAAFGVPLSLHHGGIDLFVVVASRVHVRAEQLLVGPVGDAVRDAVVFEHLLAQQGAVLLGGVALAVAVGGPLEDLDKRAVGVVVDQLIPLTPPNELDDVVAGAAEDALELLDDLRVSPHWAVQALVVAVHDHDQVVQPLVACPGDGIDGLRLVHLAVADEAPNAAGGGVGHAPEVEVAEEASLRHCRERADAHRHSRVLPEIGHQPGMRVARNTVAAHFLPEVHDLLQGEPPLEVGPGIRAGRRVALHVELVAHAAGVGLPPEEVVHSDLPDVAHGGEGADVAADPGGALVAVADHDRGVPADEV